MARNIHQRLDRLEIDAETAETVTVVDFSAWPDEPTVTTRHRRPDEPRCRVFVDIDGLGEGD